MRSVLGNPFDRSTRSGTFSEKPHTPGLQKLLQPCSRAARKWRENEEMERKWRENEEIERKWRENGEMKRKWRENEEIERKWRENEEMERK